METVAGSLSIHHKAVVHEEIVGLRRKSHDEIGVEGIQLDNHVRTEKPYVQNLLDIIEHVGISSRSRLVNEATHTGTNLLRGSNGGRELEIGIEAVRIHFRRSTSNCLGE